MDIQKIREDFPILSRTVYGKPLVYFDNGATTQKPRLVVDALVDEYYSVNANVHRGVHYLSQQATELHEASRETVRQFINAGSTNEVVFTRGTTESINLLVSSLHIAHPWHLFSSPRKRFSTNRCRRSFSASRRIVSMTSLTNANIRSKRASFSAIPRARI